MEMEWTKLLSLKTKMEREQLPECFSDYPISDVEKDYEQIISSPSFRRLQDKTQVFPLDKSDFVRTRLTHSLEVSTIARQLGIMITQNTKVYCQKDFKTDEESLKNIPAILSSAGLLHDIGNPPFGHFGEVVIGDWFKNTFPKEKFKYGNKAIKDILNEQMKKDLENFEGNAQALRILAKTHSGYPINVSYAVLNTLIKYPTDSCAFSKGVADIKKHKLGYYYSENEIMNDICKTTGTKMSGEYVRHPLTLLLEAADDIAYAAADLEDALKKGLFTIKQFMTYYSDEVEKMDKKYSKNLYQDLEKKIKEGAEDDFKVFQKWISSVKRWLMYVVVYRFFKSYDEIMEGRYQYDLFYDTNHENTIKILKGAMKKFVFNDNEILKLELAAKKIMEALLNDFIFAVIYWEEKEHADKLSKADLKYINIIPQNLRDEFIETAPKGAAERLYRKFLMVTDFISGMTDSYAKNLYQELYGLKG